MLQKFDYRVSTFPKWAHSFPLCVAFSELLVPLLKQDTFCSNKPYHRSMKSSQLWFQVRKTDSFSSCYLRSIFFWAAEHLCKIAEQSLTQKTPETLPFRHCVCHETQQSGCLERWHWLAHKQRGIWPDTRWQIEAAWGQGGWTNLEVSALGLQPVVDKALRISGKTQHELSLGLQLVNGLNGFMDLRREKHSLQIVFLQHRWVQVLQD